MADGEADRFFRVHLQSLVDFAGELQTQLDALGRPADRLETLSATTLRPGEFVEAGDLHRQHLATAGQLRDLLRKVRDAIAFTENVTGAVAAGYQEYDDEIAAGYTGAGTLYYSSSATTTDAEVKLPYGVRNG